MSYIAKYFAAFLIDRSRITLVSVALTLGGFSWDVYAANFPTIHYGANPSYDSIPITPKTWKEVDLNYFSVINGKRYQNIIDLLRPITWLHQHGMDKVGNTISLSLPEFGINHVKAYVVAIKPTTLDTRGMSWSKIDFRPVIGKFKRYALDVRTYTFRDSKGHSDHIHATPNHPFYVQNKHGFVPIEDVKDTDVLVGMGSEASLPLDDSKRIDAKGNARLDDVVRLICSKGQHNHCGKPYSDGKHPMAVYNLEVYKQHVFRVGVQGVLVHNCSLNDEGILTPSEQYINLSTEFHNDYFNRVFTAPDQSTAIDEMRNLTPLITRAKGLREEYFNKYDSFYGLKKIHGTQYDNDPMEIVFGKDLDDEAITNDTLNAISKYISLNNNDMFFQLTDHRVDYTFNAEASFNKETPLKEDQFSLRGIQYRGTSYNAIRLDTTLLGL